MTEDAPGDSVPPVADDQAKTLRLLVSSRRGKHVSDILREIEAQRAEEDLRRTPRLSAFRTKRGSDSSGVWTVPHRLMVVVGGRPGVGATTVARNLAAEVASRGLAAEYVGQEVLSAASSEGTEYYLVDSEGSVDFVGLADYLVVVATPEPPAVTGAYAALKRFRAPDPLLPAGLVVNRVSSPGEGAALAERIASAARAFLGGPGLEILGWILEDDEVRSDARDGVPFIVRTPRAAAAAGIRLCARRLSSRCRRRKLSAA